MSILRPDPPPRMMIMMLLPNSEEIGTGAGVTCGEDNDAMVLIGDMGVVAPMSFVRMRN